MSTQFDEVQLGTVVRHRKEFIQIDDSIEYKRCRVQLHAQGVVLRDVVPGLQIKTKSQQVCRAGEFLVAEIDAKLGGYGIVPPELAGAVVSSHYFLFEINEARLDRRYLGYYVRTHKFGDQIAAQGTTNYSAIRPSHVLGYSIPLPPLSEQRRIVARIDELVAKVEEARALRRMAWKETSKLWEQAASKVLLNLEAPRLPIGLVVRVLGGGTPSKHDPTFWNGSIPWISPKDMKTRRITDSIDHITERATRESPAKLIKPGAVLVVVRGMILAHTVPVAALDVEGAINQDMKALVPNELVLSEYLVTTLAAMNRYLLGLVEKSTHDTRKLETARLLAFEIPVPPLYGQSRILQRLDRLQLQVDALTLAQTESQPRLEALLPAILDRAFRGEL